MILFYHGKTRRDVEFLYIDKNISFVNDMALRRFAWCTDKSIWVKCYLYIDLYKIRYSGRLRAVQHATKAFIHFIQNK